MSLQLHRPDGRGGVEPRSDDRARLARASSARRAGAAAGAATGSPACRTRR